MFSSRWFSRIGIIFLLTVAVFSALGAAVALAAPILAATKTVALLNDVDSDGRADPGDTLRYTVIITNTGPDPATGLTFTDTIDANTTLVGGSLRVSPLAIAESYTALGNVPITVNAASGVLTNDYLGQPSATITAFSATSAQGGNVNVNADGSFTYTPPAGYEGSDTFTYTLTNALGSDTGTVTITVSGMIWFVNNQAASVGDGRLNSPFNTLAAFQAVNSGSGNNPAAGDNIFVYESASAYTGGVTLLNNQRLIGQDATQTLAVLAGVTPPSYSATLPAMSAAAPVTTINGGTNAVTLGSGNHLYGFTAGNAISGNNFGTLNVRDVIINTTGQALSLNNGAFAAAPNNAFTSVTSSGGVNNVSLTSVTSLVALGSGSLSGSSGDAFVVSNGNGSVTYSGTINKNNAGGRLVVVQNKTGGTLTLDGAISNTGAGQGIALTNNTGATINFSGNLSLNTAANAAFTATGGGTINATNTNSTINTTTGTAVNIANTSIGSSGVIFRSVNVTGAVNGIVLNTTSTGAFTITGDGTQTRNGSGGTIQNTTGDAVSLTNANNVALRQVNIVNAGQDAVESSGGGNITLSSVTLQNPTANGWLATNLTGSNYFNLGSLVTSVNSASTSGVRVTNTNTNLTLMQIEDSTFNNSTTPQSVVLIELSGTSVMGFNLYGSTFENLVAQAVTVAAGQAAGSTGTLTTNIGGPNAGDSNTFQNAPAAGGENNLGLLVGNGATHIFTAQNNTFTNVTHDTACIANTSVLRTQNSGGFMTGYIRGNNINNALNPFANCRHGIGHVNEPIAAGNFTTDLLIDGNTVSNLANREAIWADYRANAGNGNLRITNNTLGPNVASASQEAIEFRARQTTPRTVNLLIQNNTFNTASTAQEIIDIDSEMSATVNATVQNNPLGSSVSTLAYVAVASEVATSVACANISGNTIPATGVIALVQTGTLNVTQASAAAMQTANPSSIVSVTGAPTYGQAPCALPSIAFEPLRNVAAEPAAPVVVAAPVTASFDTVSLPVTRRGNARIVTAEHPRVLAAGENINVNAITLPAGKSLTIRFDVTVNTPGGFTQVCNQGTVLTNELANLLTDNPAVVGSANPTCIAVDRPATTVNSINRQTPAAASTNATSVVWRVTFADPVTGLTSSHFTLANTGLTGPSITSVSAVTGAPDTQWNVTVNTGTGNGTLGLNLANDTALSHSVTTALPFVGETYTIDKTAPAVSSIVRQSPASNPTNADVLVFRVTFSEPVTSVGVSSFVASGTTTPINGSVTAVTPNVVFDFTIDGIADGGNLPSLNGTVGLDIAASPAVTDLTGNTLQVVEPTPTATNDQTYTLDNTAPTVTVTQAVGQSDPTSVSPVNFTVTFSEDVTGFSTAADLNITGTAAGTLSGVITGGPTTYNVAVSGMTGAGTVILDIPANAAGDGAGNTSGPSSTLTDHTVTYLPPTDLTITKTDGVTSATPGGSVSYTITASNAGPSNAPGTTVADTLPASLTATWTCVGAGGGTCTAAGSGNINDIVNLPAGGSVTFTVNAAVSPAATGTMANTATVTASANVADTNAANNSATDTDTLTPQADLSITKTDGVTSATPGGSVIYTITASNAGPSNAPGTTVADTLPASLTATWTCVGAGGGTCTASGSGNINDTVNLPAGGSVTFTVNATINPAATGTLSNTATVAAPGGVTDPTPGNNSATDTDTLTPRADLSITKTDGVATATPGGSIIYTITASNAGPSNAPGATVADTFPASLTATWTCVGAGGGTCTAAGSGNINDTVNLPAGGSVTFTVNATVSPAATGILSNTATVTAPGGVTDPTPGNNSATDADTLAPPVGVTINQASGQPDPTNASPINFTVVFASAVTDFDDASDVTLSGTAGATTVVITPGSSTTYNVAVSGMTSNGTVIATIALGVATGSLGEPNAASTSTDNTVIYDATAPDTTITANPTNPTNSTSASFSFTGNDGTGVGGLTFQCKLDSGSFTACTSPQSYTGLSEGSHTFQVQAADSLGNTDATPASFTWVIDTTAPNTSITGNPTNPSSSASATFNFTGNDGTGSGIASFECKLDSGSFAACTTGVNYTSLSNGSHTFQVRAMDNVGLTDATPASYTWVVDTAAPDTTITANPANPTISASASFSFTGNDGSGSGVASFQCALDGGGFAACTSPQTYTGLANGSHTFQVRAVDVAGNVDASPASFTWVVDAAAPDTTITANPANPTNSTSASFSFTGNDGTGVGGLTFQCKLDSGSFTACTSPQSYNSLSDGSHTFQVQAADSLGNTDATPASFTWVVDTTAPTAVLSSLVNSPTNSSPILVTITFSEPVDIGTGTGDLSITNSPADPTISGGPTVYTFNLTPSANGPVTAQYLASSAVDAAGNWNTASNLLTITYDTAAPTVTINQAPGQSDPALTSPVNFIVIFNEPTTGFATGDVTLSASTTPGTLIGAVTGGPITYTVAVSGMTGDGNVIASIAASRAQDLAGNNNAASTSTDNTVAYIHNQPPTLSGLSLTSPISENGSATLAGSISGPEATDALTLLVNWGDGTVLTYTYAAGTTSFSQTHPYLDDNPTVTPSDSYTVNLSLSDGINTITNSLSAIVNNVAPLLSNVAATSINENGSTTLTGSIVDPGTLDPFTLVINWGDGAVMTSTYAAGTTAFSRTHTYLDDNPTATPADTYTVSLAITDDDSGSSVTTTHLVVSNLPPTVNAGPDQFAIDGTPIHFSGLFTDTGTLDTHTIAWNFGDGTSAAGVLTPTHTYAVGGIYTVTLTVTDDDAGVGKDTLLVTIGERADLSLSKVAPTGTLFVGPTFGYTLTVTNAGPSAATHVRVVDVFPAGLAYVAASSDCSFASGTVTCQAGTLLKGASLTLHITATANLSGTFSNTASVLADQLDPALANNQATAVVSAVSSIPFYFEDFEDPIGSEWCINRVSTTPTGRSFLGEFGNETACLNLGNIPAHTRITLSFDLYIIRSWDGNQVDKLPSVGLLDASPDYIVGPDTWRLQAAGQILLNTTFSNWSSYPQAYPGWYPGGNYPAYTGASEINTLGYVWGGVRDSVYHLTFTFEHTGSTLNLDFSALGLQAISDESWGVDNVSVAISGEPPLHKVYLPLVTR
jgi:uncharacterized repeat protein (TIGR01451 family)